MSGPDFCTTAAARNTGKQLARIPAWGRFSDGPARRAGESRRRPRADPARWAQRIRRRRALPPGERPMTAGSGPARRADARPRRRAGAPRRRAASRPPGRARSRSCAGASRTGAWADRALHGESRRLGLDARDHAFATQLAYGAVQRRATLDHVIAGMAGRPVEQLDPPVLAALRLGAFQLALPRPRGRARRGRRVGRAGQGRRRPAARGSSTPCCAGSRARGAHAWRRCPKPRRPRPPCATPTRSGSPSCGSTRSGPEAARALMAAGNRPAEAAIARQRAPHHRARARGQAARPEPSRAPALPEGLVLEAPFDAFGSPLWEEGLFMPQSRAAMTVSRLLAPRPGDRVLDLCAAPGGKTTHLAALIEDRGAVVAVERHPGPGAGARAHGRAHGCEQRRGAHRRRRAAARARRLRPRARRPALLGPRHARRAPGRALAQAPRAARRARARAGGHPPRGRRRAAPRRHARVLDLHDLARRERGRRAGVPGRTAGLHGRRPARRGARLPASPRADVPPDAAPPRRHGRLLHRPTAPRASPRERRRQGRPRRRLPGLRRAVAAAHQPPGPLPLRELPAPLRARVRVPELRRALDDRADVELRAVRSATTATRRCWCPI